MGGRTSAVTPDSWRSAAVADPIELAIVMSVSSGRCGPCCSTAPHGTIASLALYDAFGRLVMDLANVRVGALERTYELDLGYLTPGSYALRLTTGDRITSVPLVRMP